MYGTFFLIASIAAVYLIEVLFSGSITPTYEVLIRMGGLLPSHVYIDEEWNRLITAVFLHGSFNHLLFNSFALLIVGRILEPLTGTGWFLFIFFLGGVGGCYASLLNLSSNIVSIGASGAIMALFGTLLITAFRFQNKYIRVELIKSALFVLIPSIIPIASTHIDYTGHLGGAISGMAIGIPMVFLFWRSNSRNPSLKTIVWMCNIIFMIVAFGSIFQKIQEFNF